MDEHLGDALWAGQEVIAGETRLGSVIARLRAGGAEYLHVRRYGYGGDELYIPMLAISHVSNGQIHLRLPWSELAAQPWHERPAGAVESQGLPQGPSSSAA